MNAPISVIDEAKELLADQTKLIKLDDFVTRHVRRFLSETSLEKLPVDPSMTSKPFPERVHEHEAAFKDLQQIIILLAYWGTPEQLKILEKAFSRICEADREDSGVVVLYKLAWYPVQLFMYSAGIAAVAAGKYHVLKRMLAKDLKSDNKMLSAALIVASNMSGISDGFKEIPGYERRQIPYSDYLFSFLEEDFEELLFLGKEFGERFDEFEVLLGISLAALLPHRWGPIGRFGRRYRDGVDSFCRLVERGKDQGQNWPPIEQGLFDGSVENFTEAADALKNLLERRY